MAERYVLSKRAPLTTDWRKASYPDLADALVMAWRVRKRDWSVGGVSKGQEVVLDGEALARACDRIDELLSEAPKRSKRDAAEQVANEIDAGEEARGRDGLRGL